MRKNHVIIKYSISLLKCRCGNVIRYSFGMVQRESGNFLFKMAQAASLDCMLTVRPPNRLQIVCNFILCARAHTYACKSICVVAFLFLVIVDFILFCCAKLQARFVCRQQRWCCWFLVISAQIKSKQNQNKTDVSIGVVIYMMSLRILNCLIAHQYSARTAAHTFIVTKTK